MVIRISERMVDIVHSYVVQKLVAIEGIMYSGTISGPLDRIFNGFGGYCLYSHTLDKAGAVLYSIVHGHSFSDGNKRTGLLTAYLFLMYNGYSLNVPKDTTRFLERMADAVNPDAPTEIDAIAWVRRNAGKSLWAFIISEVLTVFCKVWGTDFLETMTKTMLEQNALPGIDKNQLVDRNLKRKKIQPAIACG